MNSYGHTKNTYKYMNAIGKGNKSTNKFDALTHLIEIFLGCQ
jgi:hypothetical protein